MLPAVVGQSFLLQDLETGRIVAHALLCAEARYASLIRPGDRRIDRQFATPFQWLQVEEQLSGRIISGPLHRNSAIVALLLDMDRRAAITVQHVLSTPIDAAPDEATITLDAHLTSLADTAAFA